MSSRPRPQPAVVTEEVDQRTVAEAKRIWAQDGPGDPRSRVLGHLFQKTAPLCCVFKEALPLESPLLPSAHGRGRGSGNATPLVVWTLDRPSHRRTTKKIGPRPEAASGVPRTRCLHCASSRLMRAKHYSASSSRGMGLRWRTEGPVQPHCQLRHLWAGLPCQTLLRTAQMNQTWSLPTGLVGEVEKKTGTTALSDQS